MRALASAGIKGLACAALLGAAASGPLPEKSIVDPDAAHRAACERQGMTASECNGRRIWYSATGGNERFYAYTFPQRMGITPDWFRVLRTDQRDDRFDAWGIINDPSCCVPGAANCPARSREETFGFDWCPGDDVLLRHVGRDGYVDPACGLVDAPLDDSDPHTKGGTVDPRRSSCDLHFGTSTGGLGLRKFPNPRFDAARWEKLNGGRATWEGFARFAGGKGKPESDARVSKLLDGSVEPPFLIGMACGACHIAFDPLNPPRNPARPEWENIKGLVGNQYTRMSQILGSGLSVNSLEWQMFAHVRPGVTDTSAIPNDQVNNPGTITPIVNTSQRPTFTGHPITKWRKVAACEAGRDEAVCWCDGDSDGKCWERSERSDDTTPVRIAGRAAVLPGVHSILKGGEDSIGALEAMQRVYLNIGSCAEQCWVNHFSDYRQLDPHGRNFAQTPMRIGQCRRDCPGFRAVEDRLPNVLDFLLSKEGDANDLHAARGYSRAELAGDLEREFGPGAVARGSAIFARRCAGCHSSVFANRRSAGYVSGDTAEPDFAAPSPSHPRGLRNDFMGSDEAKPASAIGTYRCRALHANHMVGQLYEEFGSPWVQTERPVVAAIREDTSGGRGYYRAPSLLNVWATAPYMHNNAIGPEVCGKPANAGNDFEVPRYVDAQGKLLPPAEQPACVRYDPSIAGRYELFRRSIDELLNPAKRGNKSTFTSAPAFQDLGVRTWDGKAEKSIFGTQFEIPAGIHAGFLNGFQHKRFVQDLLVVPELKAGVAEAIRGPGTFVQAMMERRELLRARYWSCMEDIENKGHLFGTDLPDADKRALTAFLATL